MHFHVLCSIIYNNQDREATQVSTEVYKPLCQMFLDKMTSPLIFYIFSIKDIYISYVFYFNTSLRFL